MNTPGLLRSTLRERFAFGFLAVPLATGGLPLALYLTPFYAGELGVGLATIGWVLMLVRITDILTDPLIGGLSDRTPLRYGRRAPWIALGLPVMAAATWTAFVPGADAGAGHLFVSVAVLSLGWTLIGVPLAAWTAELSPDYHERSRLTGARTWGGLLGAVLALLAPLLAAAQGDAAASRTAGLGPTLELLAWLTVGLLAVAGPWLLLAVRPAPLPRPSPTSWQGGWRLIAANRAFRRLLASSMLAAVGWNSVHALFVFFATHYLGANQQQWPLIVLAYLCAQLVGTPVIVRLAPRFEKHRLLIGGSLIQIALFALVLALPPGQWLTYAALNVALGLFAPVVAILAPSMAADVIDEDQLAQGTQRAGLFMALWAMGDKLAVALATVIALPLVAWLGFDPLAPGDEAGRRALHYGFCLVPEIASWPPWPVSGSIR